MSQPKVIVITGAGGRIAYSLIPLVCEGKIFGKDQPIHLKLVEVPVAMQRLEGVRLEIEDCAYPLVSKCEAFSSVESGMLDADVVILLGGFPRKPGMERKDLIAANTEIIQEHAQGIESFAKRDVKVLVVANPANTNALTAATVAKSIPRKNFSCLTRLDEERLKNLVSKRVNETSRDCNVTASDVKNVCIFGNHSATQVPSTEAGYVNFGIQKTPISSLCDDAWLANELCPQVQQRGATVMNAQGASSAMSAASAITKHLADWLGPEIPSNYFSMGVPSEGNPYGVPEGLFYSFPCRRLAEPGEYEIVGGMNLTTSTIEKMSITTKELSEEKQDALSSTSIKTASAAAAPQPF